LAIRGSLSYVSRFLSTERKRDTYVIPGIGTLPKRRIFICINVCPKSVGLSVCLSLLNTLKVPSYSDP
jgi:hypothetical protein